MSFLWLLDIRWWGVCALALGLGALGGEVDGRHKGAAKVKAEWEKDKNARIKRTTEIIGEQYRIRSELEVSLAARTSALAARTKLLADSVPVVLGSVGVTRIPDAARRVFDASTVRVPESGSSASPDATPARPEATVADLLGRCVENNALHLGCVDQVNGWIDWWERTSHSCERPLK